MKQNNRSAQNLLEYMLIFALVAIIGYFVAANVNLQSLKNYVFMRPSDSDNPSHIKIEAMTER